MIELAQLPLSEKPLSYHINTVFACIAVMTKKQGSHPATALYYPSRVVPQASLLHAYSS